MRTLEIALPPPLNKGLLSDSAVVIKALVLPIQHTKNGDLLKLLNYKGNDAGKITSLLPTLL